MIAAALFPMRCASVEVFKPSVLRGEILAEIEQNVGAVSCKKRGYLTLVRSTPDRPCDTANNTGQNTFTLRAYRPHLQVGPVRPSAHSNATLSFLRARRPLPAEFARTQ